MFTKEYLQKFNQEEWDVIYKFGHVNTPTSSFGSHILYTNMNSVSSSFMSLPIDDVCYSMNRIKNMDFTKITSFTTASSDFYIELDDLKQAII